MTFAILNKKIMLAFYTTGTVLESETIEVLKFLFDFYAINVRVIVLLAYQTIRVLVLEKTVIDFLFFTFIIFEH